MVVHVRYLREHVMSSYSSFNIFTQMAAVCLKPKNGRVTALKHGYEGAK
jgi:hypothetical protein